MALLNLYQPEKYNVFKGKGGTVGLCTAWNEPELLFNRSRTIQNKVAITGTLYSRQGVNVILRNLALNPTVRKMFVWGNGTLSNTRFGIAGRNLLESVWKDGVGGDGAVKGTTFKLEKEIDSAVLEKIRKNVEYVDVGQKPLNEVEAMLEKEPDGGKPYMDPVSFPDAKKETADTFPSENVGWLIRDKKILGAWLRVVDRIMRYGVVKGTQYGYQQRELIGVNWVVSGEDPGHPDFSLSADWPKELRELVSASEKAINEYHAVFLSPELPTGTSYTYGNRLMRYPNGEKTIDQIEEVIIKQLQDSPDSRRAVATTLVPSIDKDSKEPPCITQVQALQNGGRMHFLVTVRSHDIFKAAIANAFGLRTLQKTVSDKLGFGLGELQISSQSAHIYEQDWEDALKLVRCSFWERTPSTTFNQDTQADPRGNMLVSIGPEIKITFQGPGGEFLMELSGKTAKEVSKKIAQLELLSRTDHIMDVAMELQKAEIALSKNLEYHQDRPLIF